MPVSADLLRAHLDYTAWASVLGTLVHVFAADRSWLSRLTEGKPHPGFVSSADHSLAVLQNGWPLLHERWKRWALDLTQPAGVADRAPRGESRDA